MIDRLIAQLVAESLFAQQDATDVSDRQEAPETGTVPEFLQALLGTAVDFSPAGDVKAVAFDAPRQFGEGENLAGIISLLSAIPGAGFFGDILKRRSRLARRRAGIAERGADPEGVQMFENLISRQGADPSVARGARTGQEATAEAVIQRILDEGLTGGSGDEAAEAFETLIERLGGRGGSQGKP